MLPVMQQAVVCWFQVQRLGKRLPQGFVTGPVSQPPPHIYF